MQYKVITVGLPSPHVVMNDPRPYQPLPHSIILFPVPIPPLRPTPQPSFANMLIWEWQAWEFAVSKFLYHWFSHGPTGWTLSPALKKRYQRLSQPFRLSLYHMVNALSQSHSILHIASDQKLGGKVWKWSQLQTWNLTFFLLPLLNSFYVCSVNFGHCVWFCFCIGYALVWCVCVWVCGRGDGERRSCAMQFILQSPQRTCNEAAGSNNHVTMATITGIVYCLPAPTCELTKICK